MTDVKTFRWKPAAVHSASEETRKPPREACTAAGFHRNSLLSVLVGFVCVPGNVVVAPVCAVPVPACVVPFPVYVVSKEALPVPVKMPPVRGARRTPGQAQLTPTPVTPSPVYSVAFSPDGKRLAVGGYKRVSVYDTETGKRLAQFVVNKDAVRSVAWSNDGTKLAAGGGVAATSGSVAVVNAVNGKPVRVFEDRKSVV